MSQIHLTQRDGQTRLVDGVNGDTVMETLKAAGVDEILALCGGSCSCSTCHVYVDEADLAQLPPASDFELGLLDASEHRQTNSRLSCQIYLSSDLDLVHVTVAPED